MPYSARQMAYIRSGGNYGRRMRATAKQNARPQGS